MEAIESNGRLTAGELEDDDFSPEEMEFDSDEEYEWGHEFEAASPWSEEEEMDLAAELLQVSNDEELDLFLGKLWRKAKRFARKSFPWVKKALRKVAKVAIPIAGRVAGTYFGGPVGGFVGSKAGGLLTRLLRLELEGMSPEDQEFEVARRIVRLAGTAAQKASAAPLHIPQHLAEQQAFVAAARQHLPGLAQRLESSRLWASGSSGRWVRRGRRIVVIGA